MGQAQRSSFWLKASKLPRFPRTGVSAGEWARKWKGCVQAILLFTSHRRNSSVKPTRSVRSLHGWFSLLIVTRIYTMPAFQPSMTSRENCGTAHKRTKTNERLGAQQTAATYICTSKYICSSSIILHQHISGRRKASTSPSTPPTRCSAPLCSPFPASEHLD